MLTTHSSRRAVAALAAAALAGTLAGVAPATASPAATPSSVRGAAGDRAQSPRTLEQHKTIAVRVLKGLFEDADLSLADRYIRPDYIQHNAQAPDGVEAIKDFVRFGTAQFPDLRYDVKRVMSEGDLVLVHSNVVFVPGTRGQAVVDIFRFQDGMIAEHWDVLQDVPETTASGNDMFSTVSTPRTDRPGPQGRTAFSKQVATRYFDTLLVSKDPDAVRFLSPEYHQHNPGIPSGSAGLREQFTAFFDQFPELTVDRKRVVAEGNLVAIHAHYRLTPDDLGQAVVDIFRVRNGRVVEHWDVVQDVPVTSANDNTMF